MDLVGTTGFTSETKTDIAIGTDREDHAGTTIVADAPVQLHLAMTEEEHGAEEDDGDKRLSAFPGCPSSLKKCEQALEGTEKGEAFFCSDSRWLQAHNKNRSFRGKAVLGTARLKKGSDLAKRLSAQRRVALY